MRMKATVVSDGSPTAPKNVFMLTTRIKPPTAVPMIRGQYADDIRRDGGGDQTAEEQEPQRSSTAPSARLRLIRKPTLAQTAITNSLVSTVPMILRGSIRPEESSVGPRWNLSHRSRRRRGTWLQTRADPKRAGNRPYP